MAWIDLQGLRLTARYTVLTPKPCGPNSNPNPDPNPNVIDMSDG